MWPWLSSLQSQFPRVKLPRDEHRYRYHHDVLINDDIEARLFRISDINSQIWRSHKNQSTIRSSVLEEDKKLDEDKKKIKLILVLRIIY